MEDVVVVVVVEFAFEFFEIVDGRFGGGHLGERLFGRGRGSGGGAGASGGRGGGGSDTTDQLPARFAWPLLLHLEQAGAVESRLGEDGRQVDDCRQDEEQDLRAKSNRKVELKPGWSSSTILDI